MSFDESLQKGSSQNRSVGIETDYGAEWPEFKSRQGTDFSLLQKRLRPTQHPIKWLLGATFQGIKRAEREVDHSPPFHDGVKNIEAIPPLPHKSSWRCSCPN
jgi:hypothetical protein